MHFHELNSQSKFYTGLFNKRKIKTCNPMKNRFSFSRLCPLVISLTFLLTGAIRAQAPQHCATMENLERLKDLDPNMAERMEAIEEQTQEYINAISSQKNGAVTTMGTVYRIPVVVHVVYNTTAQNITDAQIQSQIDVLNEDFRRVNADKINTPSAFSSLGADVEIEFCLASVSPTGTATTGIIRKQTSVTSWGQDDAVKYSVNGGSDAWPANKYLNFWVCNLGGGLLGYAQFPGGPAATDGVVINYQYFGRNYSTVSPYNKGRTATHEVGHWLNLYHIWGDDNGACTGSDNVSDTPNQGAEHYGCPAFPSASCSNGANGDMFMNYMDYTDDACMNMFSAGQKTRMRALLDPAGARVGLTTSGGCGTSTATPAYCAANGGSTQYEWISNVSVNTINNTTTGSGGYADYSSISTSLTKGAAYTISLKPGFASSAYSEYFKVYIDYNNDKDFADAGENVYTSAATTTTVTGSFTIPSTAVTGTTRMRVMMSDGAVTSSCGSFNYGEVEDYTVNLTTGTTTSCGTPSGLSASSVTAGSAALSWAAISGASSYTVRYKSTSSTTWSSVTSTTTSKAISGLAASTQYEFQVQAVCGTAGSFSSSAYFTTSASAVSATTVVVGTGAGVTGVTPYGTYYMDERTQFIITQSELTAGGWTAANSYLRSLAFYVTAASTQALNGFTIKVANTGATAFSTSSFLTGTFTTVYSGNVTAAANSWNTYNFSTAFNYNGTGSLLVEICWNNSSYTSNSSVNYTATSAYRTLSYRADVAAGGVCGNATGTLTYNRPNMRMVFKNSATGKLLGDESVEATALTDETISNVNVFPNPATTNVSVEFSLNGNKNVNVRIFDMTGRVVASQDYAGTEGVNLLNMDISNLEQGNYILMIDDTASGVKKRLMIAK
jgi:hypothetical protein